MIPNWLIFGLLVTIAGSFAKVVEVTLTLQPGQTVNYECNASVPVHWLAKPSTVDSYQDILTISLNDRAWIRFLNVSQHNVGRYICVSKVNMGSVNKLFKILNVSLMNATSTEPIMSKKIMSRMLHVPIGLEIETMLHNTTVDGNEFSSESSPEDISNSFLVLFLIVVLVIILLGVTGITIVWRKLSEYKKDKQKRNDQWTEFVGECNLRLARTESNDVPFWLQRWEYPQDKLRIEEKLGEGCFGVVHRAIAQNILPDEEETVVAVKMLKDMANAQYMQALEGELRIMRKLGRHLNVVNMLGTITANTLKTGQMMIIMEYCRFGSLKAYIIKCRENFIDQRTSDGGIDSNVVSLAQTEEPENVITTTDLVCWAYQVARGMSYLASRKIVHGDLALRNLLLCDENVVKISDFGLAKELQDRFSYLMDETCKVPVKWLALESIEKGVFSIETDIWAFGVVLWEVFSLAEAPYNCVPSENFVDLLKGGSRLECPKFATGKLYELMVTCWHVAAHTRPPFNHLTKVLEEMLPNEVKMQFVQTYLVEKRRNSRINLDSDYPDLMTVMRRRPTVMLPRISETIYIDDDVPQIVAPAPPNP